MNWFSPYHVIRDYHAKTITLVILGISILEGKGTQSHYLGNMISFLKDQWLDEKGYLFYLDSICDTSILVHYIWY